MSRLEKVPFWFAVGLVWLFSLVVILGGYNCHRACQRQTPLQWRTYKRVRPPEFLPKWRVRSPVQHVSSASRSLVISRPPS